MPQASPGGVAEWSKALVLKTRGANTPQGSNPCPSANDTRKPLILVLLTEREHDALHSDKRRKG